MCLASSQRILSPFLPNLRRKPVSRLSDKIVICRNYFKQCGVTLLPWWSDLRETIMCQARSLPSTGDNLTEMVLLPSQWSCVMRCQMEIVYAVGESRLTDSALVTTVAAGWTAYKWELRAPILTGCDCETIIQTTSHLVVCLLV